VLVIATDPKKNWSTVQIVIPIAVGVSLLATFTALFFCYSQRTRRTYAMAGITGGRWQSMYHSVGRLLGFKSSAPQAGNTSGGRNRAWTIDEFELGDGQDGKPWLAPSSTPLRKPLDHGFQHFTRQFWRNPFKKRPIKVISLPPRRGFRVDDIDLNTLASDPLHPTVENGRSHEHDTVTNDLDSWTVVEANEIFDSHDEGQDERSVLLISRAPGVNFDVPPETPSPTIKFQINPPPQEHTIRPIHQSHTSPTSPNQSLAPTSPRSFGYSHSYSVENIIPPAHAPPTSPIPPIPPNQKLPPTSPYSFVNSRNQSRESMIRPARTDPAMLFPASVRAAGYNPYSAHTRDISSDSQLANAIPLTPVRMP
jgi:hypothetical protein